MKARSTNFLGAPVHRYLLLLQVLWLLFMPEAFSQSTAFTYQGHLMDNGASANGNYDIQFTLKNALTGGITVGTPLVVAPTTAVNGIFTVTLDFGSGPFDGSNRWVELAVRPYGSVADYTVLAPRQQLTSAPHAVRALNAGAAATAVTATNATNAANLTGTLTGGNVPAEFITGSMLANGAVTSANLAAGVMSAPMIVSSANQTAAVNTSYFTTGTSPTMFTLPATATVGDAVYLTGAGTGGWSVFVPAEWTARESDRNWRAVASSADGTKLVAVAYSERIYTSADSGVSWTPREISRLWQDVASSADGTKLVAVVQSASNGLIYTSTDSGVSWTSRENARNWRAVASSADGTKLVAVVQSGQIYTSTDSGVSWTARESARNWDAVASSADGTKLVAVVFGGQIYTSTDSGVSWTARESSRTWESVASSADGNKLVAVVSAGRIYTSTDSGVSWTPRESDRSWHSVASSADGTRLVAAVLLDGQIYTSTDSGVTWTARESDRQWRSVASSADGMKLVAAVFNGQIYTSADSILSGAQGTTVMLQYIGNGAWGAASETNIAAGAVGTTQIAANAVQSGNIAIGAVGTTHLADSSVNSLKIADATIVNADIATDANIDALKFGTGAVSTTELNFLDGVTSSIQVQLDGKLSGPISNVHVATAANIDAIKLGTGVVSNTEFNFLNGVTSSIQTQLGTKLNLSGGTLTGGLTAPALTYATPQTRYLAVPAAAFRPTVSTTSYNSTTTGITLTSTAGGPVNFTAPVVLPHGAVITAMKLVALDNDAGLNMTAVLRYAVDTSSTNNTIATVATSGASATAQEVTSGALSKTVANDAERIFLTASWDSTAGNSIDLRQVTITYTVTSPLP